MTFQTARHPRGLPARRKLTRHAAPRNRRGTTLFELLITLGVVGVLSASIVPMLRWSNLQQRESERRMVAQEEVRNVLERAAALPWDELRQDVVEAWKPSGAAAQLPEPRLVVRVDDLPEESPPARRVRAELSWNMGSQRPALPVRVTAWFYPPPEERP